MPDTIEQSSILKTVKQGLGIPLAETAFDPEIVININSVLASIVNMGIGVQTGYEITGCSETWTDFLGKEDKRLSMIRTLVTLKVRKTFDPPQNVNVMKALDEQIKEYETRIFLLSEDEQYLDKDLQDSYSKPKKLSDYLYQINYSKLDYKLGKEFVEKKFKPVASGCSSIKAGNIFGRNLDWFYNFEANIVIRTKRTEEYYATIGIASTNPELTKHTMSILDKSEMFNVVPFTIVDGLNECGLFISSHVVYAEKGSTTGTVPLVEKKDSICTSMLPRYILDRFASARYAIQYIKDYVSVYANKALTDMGMEAHFLIGDRVECFALEFINNQIVVTETNKLTNFLVDGVLFNEDGTVYTPETSDADHKPTSINNITPLGMGLERYNIMALASIVDISLVPGMASLLRESLNYNNSYTNTENKWYTEFVGEHSGATLTVNSDMSDFNSVIETATNMFAHRNRCYDKDGVWHTTHSAIYDIANFRLYVIDSSEDSVMHTIQ